MDSINFTYIRRSVKVLQLFCKWNKGSRKSPIGEIIDKKSSKVKKNHSPTLIIFSIFLSSVNFVNQFCFDITIPSNTTIVIVSSCRPPCWLDFDGAARSANRDKASASELRARLYETCILGAGLARACMQKVCQRRAEKFNIF